MNGSKETGLKLALTETPKTGFLATRPINKDHHREISIDRGAAANTNNSDINERKGNIKADIEQQS